MRTKAETYMSRGYTHNIHQYFHTYLYASKTNSGGSVGTRQKSLPFVLKEQGEGKELLGGSRVGFAGNHHTGENRQGAGK